MSENERRATTLRRAETDRSPIEPFTDEEAEALGSMADLLSLAFARSTGAQ